MRKRLGVLSTGLVNTRAEGKKGQSLLALSPSNGRLISEVPLK